MIAYLEHLREQRGPLERVEITKNPFKIGRSRVADLTVYSHKVSKDHAQILQDSAGFFIRDLGSTNGTFVNGTRIDERRLSDGDIIHVAHWEFGFGIDHPLGLCVSNTVSMTQETEHREKESLIKISNFLHEMVSDESVAIVFQTIVDLRTGAVLGYEALGRGRHHRLHQSPIKLFELAEKCRMERYLCRLFRTHALKVGAELPSRFRLFLNIHPSEFTQHAFLESLEELHQRNAERRQVVIEISERSVTNALQLRAIKRKLEELGMELAYDDFGVGQARLLELGECPPHFLKLDRSLVQSMETSETSRDLIRVFLAAIAQTGIQVIAEGIETERAAELCLESGCHLGQGFLYGRPGSLLEVVPSIRRQPHVLGPG